MKQFFVASWNTTSWRVLGRSTLIRRTLLPMTESHRLIGAKRSRSF